MAQDAALGRLGIDVGSTAAFMALLAVNSVLYISDQRGAGG
jgi:activator of 2-hydroxyglutaryl-CoA dehydratase